MTPEDLLSRAAAEPADSLQRPLLIAAAVSLAVGRDFILVGGAAVNVHTSIYQPTDIDLVGYLSDADRQTLLGLGLAPRGRYFLFETPHGDELIEFPAVRLFELAEKEADVVEVAPGVTARVISLDDLVVDRLLQATDGTDVTVGEAVRLAVGVYSRVDWDDIHRRVAEAAHHGRTVAERALPDTLKMVQRKAKQALRRARPGG